jgi:hypothetical protein
MEIQVRHRIPTTVEVVDVKLPHYFKLGTYVPRYCCMTEEGKYIEIFANGGYMTIDVSTYSDTADITCKMEKELSDASYELLDEAVFYHKFSEAHRELFYYINPQVRPKP